MSQRALRKSDEVSEAASFEARSSINDGGKNLASVATISGTYELFSGDLRTSLGAEDLSPAGAGNEASLPVTAESLRLDVDGPYPQLTASGRIRRTSASITYWVAELTSQPDGTWTGGIWYKSGDVSIFPYTAVAIKVLPGASPGQQRARVTFSAGGGTDRIRLYTYESPYFHSVDFEFDSAEGEAPTLTVDTCAHPNRPATLPCETLSIAKVFRRAGFDVTQSNAGSIPLSGAGPNAKWSDTEMHDAMQTYWSRFSTKAQWGMWVFFASLHDIGTDLGGIMFDDIGPNHRQGTAIFNDAFISNAPAGDPQPAAWVQRMIFWTACHEMGHAFNLAHSWQKSLGKSWIPLADQPEARSFMNYPYNVSGGQTAFFANFKYRFSDEEMLFMRHAPGKFVQMGKADWFDDHGFEEANVSPEPALRIEVRVNRDRPVFEFMEPVILELKLTNESGQTQLIDEHTLSLNDSMIVITKRDQRRAKRLLPFANYCWEPSRRTLAPGESIYEPLLVSAGRDGWDIAEPGKYTVQIALHGDHEDIVSNALRLRVAPPHDRAEEIIAQDFFSQDVGRILSFDGSRFLSHGNDTLREVVERFEERRVAVHASQALGNADALDFKQLVEGKNAPLAISVDPARPDQARRALGNALIGRATQAVESLGHIGFRRSVDAFSRWMSEQGERDEAAKMQDVLYDTLSTREVRGRRVLDSVLQDIEEQRDAYKIGT